MVGRRWGSREERVRGEKNMRWGRESKWGGEYVVRG